MKIKNRTAIDCMLPTVKHSRRKLKYENSERPEIAREGGGSNNEQARHRGQ